MEEKQVLKVNMDGSGAVDYSGKNFEHSQEQHKKQVLWDPEELKNLESRPEGASVESNSNKEKQSSPPMGNTSTANAAGPTKSSANYTYSGDPSKKKKKWLGFSAVAVTVVLAFLVIDASLPGIRYNKAMTALESGDYVTAEEYFRLAGNYKDAPSQIEHTMKASQYAEALQMEADGKFMQAATAFREMIGYEDAEAKTISCYIQAAEKAISDGKTDVARDAYVQAQILGSSDASNLLMELGYASLEKENFKEASDIFKVSKASKAQKFMFYAGALEYWKEKRFDYSALQLKSALGEIDDYPGFKQFCCDLGYALLNGDDPNYSRANEFFTYAVEHFTAAQDADIQSLAKDGLAGCQVAEAYTHMQDGDLRAARDAIENVPENAKFSKATAKEITETLAAYSKFVDICGWWKIFSAKITCHASWIGGRYGSGTLLVPDGDIQIKCFIQPDNTVEIQGRFRQVVGRASGTSWPTETLPYVFAKGIAQRTGATTIKDGNEQYILRYTNDGLKFEHNFREVLKEDSSRSYYHNLSYDCILEKTDLNWN